MPFAITLRFNSSSASALEEMWQALSIAGIDSDRVQLGYAPHVTLAIYPDDTPILRLQAALEQVGRDWDALPVTLSGFGTFPGSSSVLWAAPIVTPSLLARHSAMQAALPDLLVHAHYRVGSWVPHVTLASALNDPGRALSVLLPLWRPIRGFLNQLDLVRFRPVEVLQSYPLPSDRT